MENLNEDLIKEILVRLPRPSLAKFQLVMAYPNIFSFFHQRIRHRKPLLLQFHPQRHQQQRKRQPIPNNNSIPSESKKDIKDSPPKSKES